MAQEATGRRHDRVRAWFARRGLVRPRRGRWVGGVAAGIARKTGMRPLVVRLLFVLSLFLPGTQVLVYVVLWILMPAED